MALMLKRLREAAGMTQKQVAAAIGGSYRAIQSWEAGKTFPDADKVWELAELFSTDPNTLLGWYENHPKDMADASQQDPFVKELVTCYQSSTPDRQDRILDTARDAAGMSKEMAERHMPEAKKQIA